MYIGTRLRCGSCSYDGEVVYVYAWSGVAYSSVRAVSCPISEGIELVSSLPSN